MLLENLLKELGSKIDQEPVVSTLGSCQLTLNNKYILKFEKGLRPDTFFLFAIVDILQDDLPEFYMTLLKANLFGSKSGNASLGINNENNAVILFQEFKEPSLEFQSFEKELATFMSYLDYWQNQSIQQKTIDPNRHFMMDSSISGLVKKGFQGFNFV